jgi:15-cis-phytoene synthase/lycopene beta-cyclase
MTVLTLPRRPIAASLWLGLQVVGAFLVNEAHGRRWYSGWTPAFVRVQSHAFYLGWIFVWISPVIAFLTFLGARYGKAGRRTFVLSSMWLVIVDTYVRSLAR